MSTTSKPKLLLIREDNDQPDDLANLTIDAEFLYAELGPRSLGKLMRDNLSLVIFHVDKQFDLFAEIVQWIKSEARIKDIPLICFSETVEQVLDALDTQKLKAIDVCTRPINPRALQAKVNQYLQLYCQTEIAETIPETSFEGTEILLVEDNQTNRMIAEMMFDDLGCNVTMAEDGQEAITLLEHNQYNIIFMDCHMPNMDGYEAARLIKNKMEQSKLHTCPIIAFTASERKDDRRKCARAGMNDYISKPVQEDALKAVLAKWA